MSSTYHLWQKPISMSHIFHKHPITTTPPHPQKLRHSRARGRFSGRDVHPEKTNLADNPLSRSAGEGQGEGDRGGSAGPEGLPQPPTQSNLHTQQTPIIPILQKSFTSWFSTNTPNNHNNKIPEIPPIPKIPVQTTTTRSEFSV